MIVDAHCHAWAHWPYQPPVPDPETRGSAAQLLWELDQNGVSRAVVICAGIGRNDDNNDDVHRAARASGGRLVAFCDLDSRWSATHHVPGAPGRWRVALDRFRPLGVTHYLHEDADPGWLAGAEGQACLSLLEERGVILSLACGPRQVPAIARAVAAHPCLVVLIHHLGRVRAGDDEALAAVLAGAAAPNLYVKASGFGYGVENGWDYPLPAMQDILRALRDAYGAHRLCWGSDYPVVRRFMTYRQSLEIVRTHCAFLSPEEKRMVLGGTMAGLLERATEGAGR
jgi:predicted TIM-barrel fold metal-dependent hydrolase